MQLTPPSKKGAKKTSKIFTQVTPKGKKKPHNHQNGTESLSFASMLEHKNTQRTQHHSNPKKDKAPSVRVTRSLPQTHLTQTKLQENPNSKTAKRTNVARFKEQTPTHFNLEGALKIQKTRDMKTLRDVEKIAQTHNLNLQKLQLTQEKPQASSMRGRKMHFDKPTSSAIALEPKKQAKSTTTQRSEILHPTKTHKNHHTKHTAQGPQANAAVMTAPTAPIAQNAPILPLEQREITQSHPMMKNEEVKLGDLLKQDFKSEMTEDKKESKTQDPLPTEIKKETQFKVAQSRETLTHFSQRLKEEIANYKPPFTKLSIELNPQELGKLEITITKKGKELQVNVNANNTNALQAFLQNQAEFKNTLSSVGFSNVELNFSQGEGGNKQQQQQKEKGNKNSLEEYQEIPLATSMEITMAQYA
ncbi:hypothetical protein BBW65_00260 [Helicobacter enhydrae]|uniref:Flagellar hook-length control protein-like C-terminal domain-containing protein n=1 Tax=Helicobacter enhydrae TaxID=222136 RepID=A0A1B1U3K5_9HELI|nr:hypothetical protein BBW65_00260 [Helicobacter enhydrae]